MKEGERMVDNLLDIFVMDNQYHEKAIAHAQEKGMALNNLNVLMQPEAWEILGDLIYNGEYETKPTTIHYLDKKTGNPLTYDQAMARQMKEVREIYVMEPLDRVVWNMFYQICYDRFSDLIHPNCVSYKRKVSTGTVAVEVSKELKKMGRYNGTKDDLSKYFDSVPIEVIDQMLDKMERMEPSKIWKVIRKFYHDNRVIINGKEVERYGSLKQGCAFACLLADIILWDVDEKISALDVLYKRYSDDILIIGRDSVKARYMLGRLLEDKGLKLNPKKTEYITEKNWFSFLGFKFKGGDISVAEKTLKGIQHKVKVMTFSVTRQKKRPATKAEIRKMIKDIQYYFFTAYAKSQENFGMGCYLFATVNVEHDLIEIENYIKDALRAAYTNKSDIYGLGSVDGKYAVTHGKGRNVAMNYTKTHGEEFEHGDLLKECGWVSLIHMWRSYYNGKAVFDGEILKMKNGTMMY